MRLEPFGVFVEIAPEVEGLVHISAMAERHITKSLCVRLEHHERPHPRPRRARD